MTALQKAWIGFGFSFVALVVYLSLTPDPLDLDFQLPFKVGHVIAYLWLMLWFSQVLRSARSRAMLALALVALAVVLEVAQGMTSYRTYSYRDMRDGAIGVALGWMVATTFVGGFFVAIQRRYLRP